MSVYSIGVDLTDIARIEAVIARQGERFLKRIYTEAEIAYCRSKGAPAESFAARFATKEALFKATGKGFAERLRWTDVEVVTDERGRPFVRLHNEAARLLAGKRVHLSLSHAGDMAIAMVVVDDAPSP